MQQTKKTNEAAWLMNSKQAAKALGISARKLWELTHCNHIRSARIDSAVRYDPEDLRRFVESRKTRQAA